MKREIPVAVSTDDNYAIPTYVMLHSMLTNSRKYLYKVVVLTQNGLSDKYVDLLNSLSDIFENCKIKWVNMGEVFNDSKLYLGHTTIPSMYRLMLPDILNEYDKCIYLDGDAIILGDISELYDIELGKNLVGAVRDIEAEEYVNKFDYEIYPPTDSYVNSGMLLMNLKALREEKKVAEFLELSKKKMLFLDQDIVNISCKDRISFVPLKYNVLIKYRFVNFKLKKYKENIEKYFSRQEIWDAIENPIMVHYAQPVKPWQCRYIYKGDKWYKYINNNIEKDEINNIIKPFINSKKLSNKKKNRLAIRYYLYKIGLYKIILLMTKKL